MKTGLSTASLFLRRCNEDALPFLESEGISIAEVFLSTFSEYGEPFASLLKERKGKVQINSVHILNTQFEPQLFNANPRTLQDAYDWLDKVLTSANALGAPYYTFHGTARMKKASREKGADKFDKMVKGFRRVMDTCKQRNVTLCLENVEWATYNRPGVFSRLAEDLPDLRGVLDIKQARISDHPYEAYLTEMGERLAYAHISDYNEDSKTMCLPGKGHFDFDTLVRRLKDVGFDGALLIEVYENDFKEEKELKIACDYVDEILYKHGCLTKKNNLHFFCKNY